jgi:hypothetical protein
MKTRSFFTLIMMIITSSVLVSFTIFQDDDDITNNIVKAIRSGDSKELSKFFNSTIDLTVPGNEGSFSKTQAEIIVKDFFAKNQPDSFTVNNQGSSKGGAKFSIGALVTSDKTYRVYFLIKKNTDKYQIQQLQFEVE